MQDNFFKDPQRMAKFLARMRTLMEDRGLKTQEEFNAAIGTQRALTRWKMGESTPGVASLVAIKKVFGKSLDWIILGEEPSYRLIEAGRDDYDTRPAPPADPVLLGQVLEIADLVLKTHKLKLTPGQRGRLVAKVYDQCATDRIKPDDIMVKRYLLLID